MIDKDHLRYLFAERLHAALDHKGVRIRGRGADIIRQLKQKGLTKTAQAVSKWLNGAAMPEVDSLTVLSDWLGVRREWLEHGVMPVYPEDKPTSSDEMSDYQVGNAERFRSVPLIDWNQAGAVSTDFQPKNSQHLIPCPIQISASGYALQVVGDSMTSTGTGRSYPNGCIIFVDPELPVHGGDRVIARLPTIEEATFKVLTRDAGKEYLKPLNPQYPMIEFSHDSKICGKVIGAFIKD